MIRYKCMFEFRYDHPHIIAGQGTLGLEVVEQIKDIDAIVVPVGGGGLIAGVALAAKTLQPNIKIIVSIILYFRSINGAFRSKNGGFRSMFGLSWQPWLITPIIKY